MVVKKILRKIKAKLFPSKPKLSEFQVLIKKWRLDNGDGTLRLDYDLNEQSIVFDLGGYEGQWASDIYDKYGCNIFIFEPVNSFATKISERFRENNKIKVFTYGLGGYTRSEIIYISGVGSSIYREGETGESIEIIDVKDWMDRNSISHINLMKINIEGGEYELLDRMIECNLIKIIDDIQVQFHKIKAIDDPVSRMEKIQKELAKTHELTYQYNFIWENWRRKKESTQ